MVNKYKRPNIGPSLRPGSNQTGRWRWHFNKIFPLKLRRINDVSK